MNKVFIKHNPYKLSTYIEVDGKEPKENSRLNFGERRLQEWFEELPSILKDEYGTKNFEITFHGTILDFEDMKELISLAKKQDINFELKHIKGQEIEDKEEKIDKLFQKIQSGPIDELRDSDIRDAFETAKNSDFRVSVVATMSSGKSTLINALLGSQLMPSKNEACTAIITEIKDTDAKRINAIVYDKNGHEISRHAGLTYEMMQNINSDERVSKVCVEGNIPFVNSENISLILVDTPGPNNSRDEAHKETTYNLLQKKSRALVLYIMNATQLAVNDDKNLLLDIARCMKENGKQARDRFIFVLNKLDQFKKRDDSVESALKKVREYLRDEIGIENPNIYPVSALTALEIRTLLSKNLVNEEIDEDEIDEAELKVKKFNKQEQLHLEKYAPLPISVKNIITESLKKANRNETALIHSGVISLEKAIELYVEKYARTLKIRNVVSTFENKLDQANALAKLRTNLTKNQETREKNLKKITEIQKRLNDGREAEKFKERVQAINFDKEIEEQASIVVVGVQTEFIERLEVLRVNKLKIDEVERATASIDKSIGDLQVKFKVNLENLIEENVDKSARNMLEEYKNKLKSLANEFSNDIENNDIEVFEIMQGDIDIDVESMIQEKTYSERVAVGTKWVKNTDKKWYKPWTWFENSGHEETIYENVEYVDTEEILSNYLRVIEEFLMDNVELALKYAKDKTQNIKDIFSQKFDELDNNLNKKLDDLKKCMEDTEILDITIKNCEDKIKWIENIKNELNSILDI